MLYKFKCKECEKVIEDVNKRRFDYNVEQHKLKHKRQNDRRKTNKKKK